MLFTADMFQPPSRSSSM